MRIETSAVSVGSIFNFSVILIDLGPPFIKLFILNYDYMNILGL